MTRKTVILFDLDGTIVDSFASVKSAIVKTLERLACPVPKGLDCVQEVGHLLPVAVKSLPPSVSFTRFKQEYDMVLRTDPLAGVSVPEGIPTMLAQLRKEHDLVVLTNKRQEVAEAICWTFFPPGTFIHVIGRTTTASLKPSGPITEELYQRDIPLSAVRLLIGDSDEDRKTALRLGVEYADVQDFLPKQHKKVAFWEKIIIILTIMTASFTCAQAQKHAGTQKVGILVAMEKEYRLLKDIAKDDQVVIMQCGIGKVNAAMACVEMIREQRPGVVVAIGCAGGNGEGIHIGDVVVSTETAYHDVYCGNDIVYGQVQGMPERYATPQWIVDAALKLEGHVCPGLVVTGDWFVDSKEKMREIVTHFPEAMASDMESAAIAQVCHRYGVPFVSLRIVSDIPLADEHASQYKGFWSTVSAKTFSIARDFVKQITKD